MARIPSSSASDDELEEEDEEEEHRNLVPQSETKRPLRSSALEIGHLPARIGGRGGFFSRKCCLHFLFLLALLSLLIVLLLLFFYRGGSIGGANFPLDRMRESELRALYLLRDQQLGLLKLWNRTRSAALDVAAPPSSAPNSTSVRTDLGKAAAFDELRSALFEQIKLNKKIQNALLSSHNVGNSSSSGTSDDNVFFGLSSLGVDVCRKVDRPASRRTIEWEPKKDRYLFAICLSGQMSNHLICLEKHMFFAALLDRVLVLPSPRFDYQYDQVLDIDHINECFGRKVVIKFDEFSETLKNKMKIDRFICYMASPPCYLDEEHIKRLKDLGLSLGWWSTCSYMQDVDPTKSTHLSHSAAVCADLLGQQLHSSAFPSTWVLEVLVS
ncbi:hypothetical protein BHE74_00021440 [Ensete ventricosum]|nr:hypothetical protein BHE74_00021440 [Ensete ventricosum]